MFNITYTKIKRKNHSYQQVKNAFIFNKFNKLRVDVWEECK